jgi:hypothetical protein
MRTCIIKDMTVAIYVAFTLANRWNAYYWACERQLKGRL